MKKHALLFALMLLLSGCDNSLEQLTPIDAFPNFVLQDMDASVVAHLKELVEAIKQNSNQDKKLQFEGWLKLAHALHGYELLDGAELAYQNALLFKQRVPTVEYQLAHLFRLQGSYLRSNDLLESVIQSDNGYVPAYNNLAENLYDQGLLSEAKEVIQKSLQIEKDSAYALQILANIDGQMNQTDAAIAALHEALVLQPAATKLYANLAQLYQQQGQTEAANAARKKSGDGKLSVSDPWLSEVTMDLRGYNQFIEKAQQYLNKKDYQTALSWAVKADSDRPNNFTTLMFFGVLKVRLSEPEQALLDFRQAYLQRPDDFKVNLNLGTVYKELGKYSHAIEYYLRAVEIDDSHLSAKLSLSDAYCLDNQYVKSMDLVEALKNTSLRSQALYAGLKCQIQHKRYNQAYQLVKDNIETVGNNDAFMEFAILLLTTTPIDEHRNAQTALAWLEKLMRKQNTHRRQQLLVMALMQAKRFDEAQQVLNKLKPSPDLFIPKQSLQQLLSNKQPFILSQY
jgi:tetratricopeptide (TPR) repeat protein